MTETVILPPESRRSAGGRFIPPLLIIPFLLYHLPALTMFGWRPEGWSTQLLTIPMVSGVSWSLTWSDLFLLGGLICLFFEVLKSTMRTREYIERGEGSLVDAMTDGVLDGMQHFDGELERLAREGTISVTTALLFATNAGDLKVQLADVPAEP